MLHRDDVQREGLIEFSTNINLLWIPIITWHHLKCRPIPCTTLSSLSLGERQLNEAKQFCRFVRSILLFCCTFHFMYNHLPLPLLVLLCWESVGRVLVSSGTGLSSSIRRHTCPADSFGQGYILSSRLYSAELCHDYILLRRWIHLTLGKLSFTF